MAAAKKAKNPLGRCGTSSRHIKLKQSIFFSYLWCHSKLFCLLSRGDETFGLAGKAAYSLVLSYMSMVLIGEVNVPGKCPKVSNNGAEQRIKAYVHWQSFL